MRIDFFALGQNMMIIAVMPRRRGHEGNAAVIVHMVIPVRERFHVGAGVLHTGKAIRIAGHILHGAKQRLAVGVVVADTGRLNEGSTPN